MASTILPEQTIHYKTYFKSAIIEGLKPVFAQHVDTKLRSTKVSMEFPTSELMYPSIVVEMQERDVQNMGVGHVEFILVGDDPKYFKFRHMLYHADLELSIFALSSLDRDLICDTLVQTLMMSDMADYTNDFWDRIYYPINVASDPDAVSGPTDPRNQHRWNYLNYNSDSLRPTGETHTPQPWLSEDQLVYRAGYTVDTLGEFYSLPPAAIVGGLGVIEHVNVYPYSTGDPIPQGVDDPAPWPDPDH